jgi:hypothetical protein|tara:strand:- start:390 stop:812 length:423 start_codon:yes stop_codon:yes gene_type:complete
MGIQTNIILGGILIVSLSGSAMYINLQKTQIDKLKIELNVAIDNQKILKNAIETSKAELENQLEREKLNQEKIVELTEASNEARKEVSKLRNTFAKHDLNSLAIAKGALIEKIINRGTAKVNKELADLTNPRQFDENIIN